jgi:hypothetical protein
VQAGRVDVELLDQEGGGPQPYIRRGALIRVSVGIRTHTSEHTSGVRRALLAALIIILYRQFARSSSSSCPRPSFPPMRRKTMTLSIQSNSHALCPHCGTWFWSALHFGKSQGKRKGTPISSESALVSGFGPALSSRESVLPAPCLVVRSRRLTVSPTHPLSDVRSYSTASCALYRKPHGRGGSGFRIPDSPSVTSGVFPRQGGGRASITRCASPVRGPILRCIIPLSWLVASCASSTQG